MPVNPGIAYQKAEREFTEAQTVQDKLKALYNMLSTVPKHKGTQTLQKEIKERIKKYKSLSEKIQKQKKGKTSLFSIKKEGSAQITIVGLTNSGKSTLLSKLTNAKPLIAPYPFTTKKPEVGTLDYKGIKLQLIEIPPITKGFIETEKGPSCLALIKQSNLVLLLLKTKEEKDLLLKELKKADIQTKILIPKNFSNLKEEIWKNLNLIKVYTKQPGKEKDFPPIAMKKSSTIKDLAKEIHKDFLKKFKFARIWGSSSKFSGQQVGLDHVLKDEDVVELHLK